MKKAIIDEFGKILIQSVRDKSILDWDMILDGRMKSERARRIQKELLSYDDNDKKILQEIIPQIVDTTLHHLLWTLEQSDSISVAIQTDKDSISNIKNESDGLAGELYSEDGWIARFSKQRHFEQ